MSTDSEIAFLQWALPRLDYRWEGFRKPRGQVLKRIRERMQELGLSGGYPEYKHYLQANPKEWKQLDTLCDVTISKFFRDRKVWDYVRDQIITELMGPDISIWSAGCCNGEEPYSLSIIAEQFQANSGQKVDVEILATDRNDEVLRRANAARYPASALQELRAEEISTFFVETESCEDDYQVKESIRQRVTFEQQNIGRSLPEQVFDVILCRNLVFTYFSEPRQRQFLKRLKPHLSPSGYLVIGANEHLPQVSWLRTVHRSHRIYCKS